MRNGVLMPTRARSHTPEMRRSGHHHGISPALGDAGGVMKNLQTLLIVCKESEESRADATDDI